MRTMYDAAWPPADPHLDVCAFYIGGDTPHVWTDAEIAGQSARWRLPIYTCDNPGSRNPTNDANSAVAWLRSHSVPLGSALALDYETAVDGAYLTSFDNVVKAAGYKTMVYGSLSYVMQNPRPSAGYWTADWTTQPHLNSGAMATQYISDTQLNKSYDLSVVSDSLVLWDTNPPAPPGPAIPKEPKMILLTGMNGTDVWGLSGNLYWHVVDGAAVSGYKAAGVPEATIDAAEHAAILAAVAASKSGVSLSGSVPLSVSGTGSLTVG